MSVSGLPKTNLVKYLAAIKPWRWHPTKFGTNEMRNGKEIDEGELWAESRLKELTGDTHATARYMRGDFFTFRLTHKHIIAGRDHRPNRQG